MLEIISVRANEAHASTNSGPLLKTRQPAGSCTVVIAVVGTYHAAYKYEILGPFGTLHRQDKFLALLSTAPAGLPVTPDGLNEQFERRLRLEHRLRMGLAQGLGCSRFDESPLSVVASEWRSYSANYFCDTRGCRHALEPTTFPGDQQWTFGSGAASFDAAGGCRPAETEVAPDVTDCVLAMGLLRNMLRDAVFEGLTDLSAVVLATNSSTLDGDDQRRVELLRLHELVAEEMREWAALGWIAEGKCTLKARPLETTRHLGVVGSGDEPPFKVYDE